MPLYAHPIASNLAFGDFFTIYFDIFCNASDPFKQGVTLGSVRQPATGGPV